MKIVHRYIFRELIKIFLLTGLFLTLILFVDKALFLTDMIINRGVTFWEVMRMMLYISPAFLAITIPISVLLAVAITFNQFSADNEIVVMKACGMSFGFLMRPVMLFALIAYLLTNAVVFVLLPWGNQAFKELVFTILETRANIDIKPQVFNREFKDLVLFVKDRTADKHLQGIFIADKTSDSASKIILAEEGFIVSDPETYKIHLRLDRGAIHEHRGDDYQILRFDRYDLNLDLPGVDQLKNKAKPSLREMSAQALWQRIQKEKKQGATTDLLEVEFSKKFSIPITCFLFALVGAPLGIKSSRTGKSGGFVSAALIILIYYVVLVSAGNLGASGRIHAMGSVWVPNILLLIFTIYMVYKTVKEIPLSFFEWLFSTLRLKVIFHK